jgi:predicted nuclease with TOPRIM domain
MNETDLRQGLKLRLHDLGQHLDALRERIGRAEDAQKRKAKGMLDKLAGEHSSLVERLKQFERTSEHFRQETTADLEKTANDLSANVNDFIEWVDRDYQGNQPTL